MIKGLLGRLKSKNSLPSDLNYQEAIEVLESHSVKQRQALAKREDAAPEMLYYLAKDQSVDVRCAVAANAATPFQADTILVNDENEEVRCELARKITRLIPGIDAQEATKLLDQAVLVLEQLANDHIVRVRQIVAEELKNSVDAPPAIVKQLAQDMDRIVCVPILEYSPLLGDDDLIEIIASGAASEALCAISRRNEVSGDVSEALVSTLDVPAVASLLVNKNAQIREETLDQIIDQAETVESWHTPLVMRPDLSRRAVKRIAGFVAASLITTLSERNNLDEEDTKLLKSRVRDRIDGEENLQDETPSKEPEAKKFVKAAHKSGQLDDAFFVEQINDNNFEVIVAGIALLAKLPYSVVHRILKSRHGKVICAVVWKANLSMRTAFQIQTGPAQVPPPQIVMAKNGTDFPMGADEMDWQLNYFVNQND